MNFKRVFKSLVVTSVVKSVLEHLFSIRSTLIDIEFYNIRDKTLKKDFYLVTSLSTHGMEPP